MTAQCSKVSALAFTFRNKLWGSMFGLLKLSFHFEIMSWKWSRLEDDSLAELVNAHGEHFTFIVKYFSGRSSSECEERWHHIRNTRTPQPAATMQSPNAKNPWTKDEDDTIVRAVNSGITRWSDIAARLPNRQGKQCRERYNNHLAPDLKKTIWTTDEDKSLIKLQEQYGNSWTLIGNQMSGRSENDIKNRWNSRTFQRNLSPSTLTPSYNSTHEAIMSTSILPIVGSTDTVTSPTSRSTASSNNVETGCCNSLNIGITDADIEYIQQAAIYLRQVRELCQNGQRKWQRLSTPPRRMDNMIYKRQEALPQPPLLAGWEISHSYSTEDAHHEQCETLTVAQDSPHTHNSDQPIYPLKKRRTVLNEFARSRETMIASGAGSDTNCEATSSDGSTNLRPSRSEDELIYMALCSLGSFSCDRNLSLSSDIIQKDSAVIHSGSGGPATTGGSWSDCASTFSWHTDGGRLGSTPSSADILDSNAASSRWI